MEDNMAIKEKFLIVWILASMVAAFLVSHALGCLVAGLENACACGFASAVLVNVAAALFCGCHS
jgi:hypothetical protein